MREGELPDELKKLKTLKERKEYLEKLEKERAEINKILTEDKIDTNNESSLIEAKRRAEVVILNEV